LFSFIAKKLGFNNKNNSNSSNQNKDLFDIDFSPPVINQHTIWWNATNLKLYSLVDLPRNALSGPIQEAKAELRDKLIKTFLAENINTDIDLRDLHGIYGNILSNTDHQSFEEFVKSDDCKKAGIISQKDLQSTLNRIPNISNNKPLKLVSAEWLDNKLFWHGNKQIINLVCAVVYARKRKIELIYNANIRNYYVSRKSLIDIGTNYHVLAMPENAWRNHQLMSILFDEQLPYVRLPLLFDALILQKRHQTSYELGIKLLQSGATDIIKVIEGLINNLND